MDDRTFHDGRVRLLAGDCMKRLRELPDNSLDACLTDPPYHLTSIVQRFGGENAAPALSASQRRFRGSGGGDRMPGPDQYGRLSRGFMGKQWDGGDIAFQADLWREVYRVLKPGAHVLAFSGTRTYHRMACAIEDAGFEIRDMTAWLYGSGFPKSHDVSKGIDKSLGVAGTATEGASGKGADTVNAYGAGLNVNFAPRPGYEPATPEAAAWQGWGTALKPALEPIVVARKPLVGTVAANVLQFGTGALNIGACRVARDEECRMMAPQAEPDGRIIAQAGRRESVLELKPEGRWPANVIHDGSDEVVGAFPEAPGQQRATGPQFSPKVGTVAYGDFGRVPENAPRNDSGSAARFFYSAKADAMDRVGSKHPTVKPVDLMQYLCRLVTPPRGTVIDPFAGTGTTGHAALLEGFNAILIEREAEYRADIERRMGLVFAGEVERAHAIVKARGEEEGHETLPLFGAAP